MELDSLSSSFSRKEVIGMTGMTGTHGIVTTGSAVVEMISEIGLLRIETTDSVV